MTFAKMLCHDLIAMNMWPMQDDQVVVAMATGYVIYHHQAILLGKKETINLAPIHITAARLHNTAVDV